MLAVIVSFVPSCHYLVSGSSRPIHTGGGGGVVWFVQTPLQGSVVHEIKNLTISR